MVFEDAGHAILRTRGPAQLTAALTFGPYGGFHGHYDKLSFVFFGFGRELAVDPGRARSQAYRLPIHRNWYKATIAHNAVLVDGKSQKHCPGRRKESESRRREAGAIRARRRPRRGSGKLRRGLPGRSFSIRYARIRTIASIGCTTTGPTGPSATSQRKRSIRPKSGPAASISETRARAPPTKPCGCALRTPKSPRT